MTAGFPITANDVNARAAAVALELWQKLDQARSWYLWLSDAPHTDAFLNGINITGATATSGSDVQILRTAAADLGGPAGLWSVAHNLAHPAANNDFFFTAKGLVGVNWSGTGS